MVVVWVLRKQKHQALDSRLRGNDRGERGNDMGKSEGTSVINPGQVKQHQENLGKILSVLANKDRVTNDEVQKFLNVSPATAERYLDELQGQGKLEQIGTTGQSVYYRLKN